VAFGQNVIFSARRLVDAYIYVQKCRFYESIAALNFYVYVYIDIDNFCTSLLFTVTRSLKG